MKKHYKRAKKKWDALLAEYGTIALITYLSIFALTLLGFGIAISTGFEVESAAAGAGTWGAAYLATKLTQPIRIGATVVMTPLVAGVWHRVRGTKLDAKPKKVADVVDAADAADDE